MSTESRRRYDRWAKWARMVRRCTDCWSDTELEEKRLIDVPMYRAAPKAVIVGEAPSVHRTQPGLSFGGHSREVYEEFLSAAELSREDVYSTNVVKCALYGRRPGVHKNCVRWLFTELKLLGVDSVIIFGRRAIEAVGGPGSLKLMSGEFVVQDIRFLTYPHPMSAVYNRDMRKSYIAGVPKLMQRLSVRPKRLGEFLGKRSSDG